jgi:hypothetical protein
MPWSSACILCRRSYDVAWLAVLINTLIRERSRVCVDLIGCVQLLAAVCAVTGRGLHDWVSILEKNNDSLFCCMKKQSCGRLRSVCVHTTMSEMARREARCAMSRCLELGGGGMHLFSHLELAIVSKYITHVIWLVVVGCDTVWPCR